MSFFIANTLEGPWLILILVFVTSIINWLTKKRAEKELQRGDTESTPRETPDWEERLRRMLGEEEQSAPPAAKPPPPHAPPAPAGAAPPVIRPPGRPAPASRPTSRPIAPKLRPTLRPPNIEVAPVLVPSAEEITARAEESLQRFEQREPVLPSAAADVPPARARRSPVLGIALRQPQNARQAFIASVVFGPPKGLES